jgi:hypothetical protein
MAKSEIAMYMEVTMFHFFIKIASIQPLLKAK